MTLPLTIDTTTTNNNNTNNNNLAVADTNNSNMTTVNTIPRSRTASAPAVVARDQAAPATPRPRLPSSTSRASTQSAAAFSAPSLARRPSTVDGTVASAFLVLARGPETRRAAR
jgi:hypothetical protein